MNRLLSLCTIALLTMASQQSAYADELTVSEPRCEYLSNPLGIGSANPRLSWIIASSERGTRQSAYRILVASSSDALAKDAGDLWDSGKVESDQAAQVAYTGKALTSGARCFWKVKAWDQAGKESAWSTPATWTMGLLNRDDWKAKWIGYDAALEPETAANQEEHDFNTKGLKWVKFPAGKSGKAGQDLFLRKTIDLAADRPIHKAVLALFPDNACQAWVNAQPVGEGHRWDQTARLDVTAALKAGPNVVTIAVHNSDFLPAEIVGRLVVQFASGGDEQFPIDGTWKAASSAKEGWQGASFADSEWKTAEAAGGTPWGTQALNDQPRWPVPYLRKTFSVDKQVTRATVYVTALGAYELHLNGKQVGNDVFTPGWSEFTKRVYYQTYDVTDQVKAGNNAIGAILGDGWYASCLAFTGKRNWYGGNPRLLAQLVIELSDGSQQVVSTDNTWKASYGPIESADLLLGCQYDARKVLAGWDTSGCDDKSWAPVVENDGLAKKGGKRDVTAIVAAAVKNDKVSLKVENDRFGGDPAYLKVKSLHVEFEANGSNHTKSVVENNLLEIAGKDLKIISAEYGDLSPVAEKAPFPPQAALAEPSRRLEELSAVAVTEPTPGAYIFDLSQNMVGWARLKLSGKSGERITVRYGEMLNPDGTLYTANLRGATSTDYFVLAGNGEETLEPYFTFHGFRYVELRGLSAKPELAAVTGVVVHSDMRRTGEFECSAKLVNQLYHNIIWGQKGNYLEVPTDCPQRDERAGWTGDTQFFVPTASYNYCVAPFFTRWLNTILEDNQHADGSLPHVAPDLALGSGATAWGDAALICTYQMYRVYGDKAVIADHFPAMERYMGFVASKSKNFVPKIGGFGDWLNLDKNKTSREVIDTAYYAYLSRMMAEMATAVGRTDDAARYEKLAADVKAAFARFFSPDGSIRNSGQTGYALAFSMGLVPAELREKAAEKYVEEVNAADWHLATGFIGTPRLLPGLDAAGRDDVAYRLLLQETYPSWLFQVKLGATTMWERWDGWTPDRGFQTIGMNSFNHYAFGSVGQFLYSAVGGISAGSPAYRTIRIRPVPGEGINWARTTFDSIRGPIRTDWKLDGKTFSLHVTIPANATATVDVPAASADVVKESGVPAEKAAGVKFLRMEGPTAVFEVGSGEYHFTSEVK